MERAVVIGAAVVILAVAATIGAGIGFVVLSTDPVIQIQRNCSSGQMGPPGGCKNLVITQRTRDRVEYRYELADGTRCQGYQEIDSRGAFGLPTTSEGGTTCEGAAIPPGGTTATSTTTFRDGNPGC